jgi:hypothetical protein
VIEIDEDNPRRSTRGVVIVSDPLSKVRFAVSPVNRAGCSPHVFNQAPRDRFVHVAFHRGGDENRILSAHDLIAEKG